MGIKNLLVELKDITRRKHIGELSGQTVAIDSYCWLHHAVVRSSGEIALGIPTDQWVKQFIARVKLLQSYGITPIMVWDGRKLPAKGNVESTRAQRRVREMELALEKLEKRQKTEAAKHFQSTVDVTPEMAARCIKVLKSMDIECIVAPYEADAQLAHLCLKGRVSTVITEDSDLLVFGCKRVLYKLKADGWGEEITLTDVLDSPRSPFYGLTFAQFRQTCILAGCDYLDSVKGVGLLTAIKHMRKEMCIHRVCRAMRLQGLNVPSDYETGCSWAELVFQYQRVCTPMCNSQIRKNTNEYEGENKTQNKQEEIEEVKIMENAGASYELCHVTTRSLPTTLSKFSGSQLTHPNAPQFCAKNYSLAQCKYCSVTLSDSVRDAFVEHSACDGYPTFSDNMSERCSNSNQVDNGSSSLLQKTKNDLIAEIYKKSTCLDSQIGYPIPSNVATGVTTGLLDPDTFIPFQCALDENEDGDLLLQMNTDELLNEDLSLKVSISDNLLGVEESSDSPTPVSPSESTESEVIISTTPSIHSIEQKRYGSEEVAASRNSSPLFGNGVENSQFLMGCGQGNYDEGSESDGLEIVDFTVASVALSPSVCFSSTNSQKSTSIEGYSKDDDCVEVISSETFLRRSSTVVLEEKDAQKEQSVLNMTKVERISSVRDIGLRSTSNLGIIHLALSEITLLLLSKEEESIGETATQSHVIKDALSFLLSHIREKVNRCRSIEPNCQKTTADFIKNLVFDTFQTYPIQSNVAGIVAAGIVDATDRDRIVAYQDLWSLRKNALFKPTLNKTSGNPALSVFQKSALASKSVQTMQKAQQTCETIIITKRDVRVSSSEDKNSEMDERRNDSYLKEQIIAVQSYKNPVKFKKRSTSYSQSQTNSTMIVNRSVSTPDQRHLATVLDKRDHRINLNSPNTVTTTNVGKSCSSEQQKAHNNSQFETPTGSDRDENSELNIARSQTLWLGKGSQVSFASPASKIDLVGTPSSALDQNTSLNELTSKTREKPDSLDDTVDTQLKTKADSGMPGQQSFVYRLMSSANGIMCRKIVSSNMSTDQASFHAHNEVLTIENSLTNGEEVAEKPLEIRNATSLMESVEPPSKRPMSDVFVLGSGVSHKQLRHL